MIEIYRIIEKKFLETKQILKPIAIRPNKHPIFHKPFLILLLFLFFLSFTFFFFLLWPHLWQYMWYMEVSRLGVESDLQLLAYATAHSSARSFNSLNEARDSIHIFTDTSQILNLLSHKGSSLTVF